MRTRAPAASGANPPVSIMRPALISRSASLFIASIMDAGGGAGAWDEVTIDMKRMQKLLFEARSGKERRKSVSLQDTTIQPAPDRHAREKFCARRSEERRVGKEC